MKSYVLTLVSLGFAAALHANPAEEKILPPPSNRPSSSDSTATAENFKRLAGHRANYQSFQKGLENKTSDILVLVGDMIAKDQLVGLNSQQLDVLVGTLVMIANTDDANEGANVAVMLMNVYGDKKVIGLIKKYDSSGNYLRRLRAVTHGEQ